MPAAALRKLPLFEWANLRMQLRWAYDDVVPESGRRRTRHNSYLSAWLLRRGTAEVLSADGVRTVAAAGEWMFPPPDRRWQDFSPDAHLLSVNFKVEWPNGDFLFEPSHPVIFPAAAFPELTEAAEALVRIVRSRFPGRKTDLSLTHGSVEDYFETQKYFAAWLHAAATALMRHEVAPSRLGQIDPRVLSAVRYLDTRPIHEPISELQLVEVTGLSVSQINRLFNAQFGRSPKQYFEQRRAEIARLALRGSGVSTKQVAYQLGFRSLSHFSVWFQKHEGCPPREFRSRDTPSVGRAAVIQTPAPLTPASAA